VKGMHKIMGNFVKIIIKIKMMNKRMKSSELEVLCWEKGRESLKERKAYKGNTVSLFEFTRHACNVPKYIYC
jgi:hypothetical protein